MTRNKYSFVKISDKHIIKENLATVNMRKGGNLFSYEKFEELCKEKGVTPYQVSASTNIATATLSSWKKGVYDPKYEKMKLIAKYFGVTVDFFDTDED